MPIWDSAPQGSDGWLKARLGCLTASRFADVLGTADKRKKLMLDLIIERDSGMAVEIFVSNEMLWGIQQEANARAEYEAIRGVFVEQRGFARHETIPFLGISPDGLVEDGLIEIKCPSSRTHLGYIEDDCVPKKYMPQMDLQLIVTGRKWCDFITYDPRMVGLPKIGIWRYEPTAEHLETQLNKATDFLAEVAKLETLLKEKRNGWSE